MELLVKLSVQNINSMKKHLNLITSVFTVFLILAFQVVGYSQFTVIPEKRCFVYGVNSFKINNDYLTQNPAADFFLKIGEKEFPLTKDQTNSVLIANISAEEFPLITAEKSLRGKIIAILNGVEKNSSQMFTISAVKTLDWETIEKSWDETPIYFESGKIGIQPRQANHQANAADNTAHCLESVTFVDADGDFQTLKVGENGLKKVGKFGIVNLEFTQKNLSIGKGKLIIKHFGNPVTQEIPVRLYEKPPAKAEISLSANSQNGTISAEKSQLIESPTGSTITYCPKGYFADCPKGYFAEKEKNNLRWEMGLEVCKERPVRINGDRKRFERKV